LSNKALLLPVWASVDLIGQQSFPIIPFLVGAMVVTLDMSLVEAGWIISIEYSTLALFAIGLSPFMGIIPRRTLALCGACLVIIGNLLSAVSDPVTLSQFNVLATYRGLVGMGCGMALAAGNATVAGVKQPEKLYAKKMVLLAVYSLISLVVSPHISSAWGVRGLYIALTALSILALIPLVRLPQRMSLTADHVDTLSVHTFLTNKLYLFICITMLVATFIYNIREAFTMTYIERIGSMKLGVSPETIGAILGVGALMAMVASMAAGRAAANFGYKKSIFMGVLFSGFITIGLFHTENVNLFNGLILFWSPIFYFTWTLLMSMAAVLDDKGRVVSATGGFVLAAYAVGPGLAGYIIEKGGDASIVQVMLWIVVLNLVFALLVGWYIDSKMKNDNAGVA
jgi:predicted MFS family arabinose efflux permease